MASLPGERAPSLSLRHGVRCVPEQGVTVESVLLAVGEQIGCENISSASRMNKAVVVFLKEEQLVAQLIESGVVISGSFCPILPLATLTSKVTISNVPPFIPDEVIERELVRFGRIASPIKVILLGCKNSELKHVMSFRRQVFMFLKEPTLDISFRVMNEGKSFMIYASTAGLKCFECGDIGHKQFVCPHKVQANMNVVEDNVNGVGSDVNEAAGENVELERTETVIEQAIVEVKASDNEGIEVQENVVQSESQVVVVHDVRDDNFLNSEIASTSGVGMLNQTMGSTVEGLIVDEDKVEMRDEDTFSQMSVQENMLRRNCTKLKDLVNPDGWKSVEDIMFFTGLRSSRLALRFLDEIRSFLPGHYREVIQREDLMEKTDFSPQKLLISSTCDTSVSEDQPEEDSAISETWTIDEMSKKNLYNLCVKTVNKEALKERQPLKWTRWFGPNFPLRDQWRSLYKFPLEKRSGDLQWRLIYRAIATNRHVALLNPAVRGECEFCGDEETVEHLFLTCK
ncbi:hypothetical protein QQF64_017998 [Cirrhinus molitorella]|uniref:CCHC-type domain-containing protein n=1 Tax=Cirrhinus molitorella TaxID=172907 RepID=A0ABR3LLM6_9TELE